MTDKTEQKTLPETIDHGGPAFPVAGDGVTHGTVFGMDMREYYAAKAMQALISAGDTFQPGIADKIADSAFIFADAMIRRSKK